jgi:hypothetical protein
MKKAVSFIIALLFCNTVIAHTINYKISKPTYDNVWLEFLQQGFKHILPLGLDHILFITCIFFLNTNIKSILTQATIFTLAHSITLGLASSGYITAPSDIIEPIIAFSIAVLAIENIFQKQANPYRLIIIFLFGLVHGLGFASALSELDLPTLDFTKALISFNVGVELGQLSIIVLLFLTVKLFLEERSWYRMYVHIPSNAIIGIIALYWTITRL